MSRSPRFSLLASYCFYFNSWPFPVCPVLCPYFFVLFFPFKQTFRTLSSAATEFVCFSLRLFLYFPRAKLDILFMIWPPGDLLRADWLPLFFSVPTGWPLFPLELLFGRNSRVCSIWPLLCCWLSVVAVLACGPWLCLSPMEWVVEPPNRNLSSNFRPTSSAFWLYGNIYTIFFFQLFYTWKQRANLSAGRKNSLLCCSLLGWSNETTELFVLLLTTEEDGEGWSLLLLSWLCRCRDCCWWWWELRWGDWWLCDDEWFLVMAGIALSKNKK